FLSATHLTGANRYARHSVMVRVLTLGNLSKLRSGQVGGDFTKRLLDHLPRIGALPIEGKKPSGFLKRLQSQKGALLDEVLLHATLALEGRRVGKAAFARVLGDAVKQQRLMVWSCRVPEVARQASRLALRLICDLLSENLKWSAGGGKFNFMEEAAALRALVKKHRLHPDDALLGQSAEQRDIPWEPLGNRFALLGQGKFQKRIRSAVTSETRHSGAMIAGNKKITNNILGELRLPVPRQEVAESEVEALAAAKKIGFPVAVKPLAGHEGQGVSANLAEADEVSAAFTRAGGRKAIIEFFIEGDDHRLLVVGGRMLAAAKKIPPSVTGDGKTSIQNLVKDMNRHPSRDGKKLFKVKIGDELMRLLGAAGYTLDTVLRKGEKFVLCSTANFSTGGIPIDVTDKVHPDNRRMAVRAAEAVGLDVAGIDFLTPDISRSYKKVTSAILEVNALPGLRLHYWPAEGVPRDVTGPIVDLMFPPGAQSRVPIAVISGRTGRNYTAHVLAHILQLSGQCVGLSSQKGAFVDGESLGSEPLRGRQASRAIPRDPRVESMVLAASPMEMLKRGLGHDACEAMAILNVSKDGEEADAEKLAETKRGVAIARDAARGMVIVNAEDPAAIKLAGKINYRRIVMVSRNAKNKVVRRHIGIGGDAVVLEKKSEGAMVALYVNGRRNAVLPVQAIPAIGEKSGPWALRWCLYGLALAHGMGVAPEVAHRALKTLSLDFLKAPASVRVRDDLPFRVIVGKIGNKAALRRFGALVRNWPCKGRKLAIIPKGVKAAGAEAKLLKGALQYGKNLEVDISTAFASLESGDAVAVLAVDFDRCWRAVSLYAPETPPPPLKETEKAAK
ncbi:MAG TPA: ATP-grasp domain-containing protein, partial [Rhodospirillales bacterium]|nr:ATP-grasp domain-containing protein [Rhodospirillales bacterium]